MEASLIPLTLDSGAASQKKFRHGRDAVQWEQKLGLCCMLFVGGEAFGVRQLADAFGPNAFQRQWQSTALQGEVTVELRVEMHGFLRGLGGNTG